MKVNNIDISEYGAKQLKVEVQPPEMAVEYEIIKDEVIELDTDIPLGKINLSVYFKKENGKNILHSMSKFMSNFKKSCEMVLDGYEEIYKGYLKGSDFEKTINRDRYIVNLKLEGYFLEAEQETRFDEISTGNILLDGTRGAKCIVKVYAKNTLQNFVITGFEDEIVIKSLDAGKTIEINGITGIITIDNINAIDKVDIWKFPFLKTGETILNFSNSTDATITVKYNPMWM